MSGISLRLLEEEYRSCRTMIGKNIESMEKTEISIIFAIAVSAAFLVGIYLNVVGSGQNYSVNINDIHSIRMAHASIVRKGLPENGIFRMLAAGAMLPTILAYIGFLRFLFMDKTIRIYNNYLVNIENAFGFTINNESPSNNLFIFTKFWRSENKKARVGLFHKILWFILIVASSAFSLDLVELVSRKEDPNEWVILSLLIFFMFLLYFFYIFVSWMRNYDCSACCDCASRHTCEKTNVINFETDTKA